MSHPIPPHTWITRREQLDGVARAMAAAPWTAIDTESNSMFVYRERVCLVQLNAGGELFLVDTLALGGPPGGQRSDALDALAPLLTDRSRVKYIHGGEYDVSILKRDYGITLAGIWDTQQAASMLGWERTGYGSLVEQICGVKLAKSYTQYDWATRPFDPGALSYALDDVHYLPEVCQKLIALVAQADLDEEVAIANAAVEETVWTGGFDPEGWWGIKGLRELAPQALPIVRALWPWRDAVARELDVPPGRLINNQLLLALARRAPTDVQQLRRAGVSGRVLAKRGDELAQLIARAAKQSIPPAPPPRGRPPTPAESRRETKLKEWRRAEAERRKLPLQAVLPARALAWLKERGADDLASVPQLGPKRIRLYGEKLRALCS